MAGHGCAPWRGERGGRRWGRSGAAWGLAMGAARALGAQPGCSCSFVAAVAGLCDVLHVREEIGRRREEKRRKRREEKKGKRGKKKEIFFKLGNF
jgi:hypothetical protein